MLYPRYYYRDDFKQFEPFLLTKKPDIHTFHSGAFLNGYVIGYDTIYYILQGVGKMSALHESGEHSILSYHGPGTMYPLIRCGEQFKLENNLFFQALTDMEVMVFSGKEIVAFMQENNEFSEQTVRLFNRYINMLVCRIVDREHGNALSAISNLLYILFCDNFYSCRTNELTISQGEIAEITGMSRVHVNRTLQALVSQGSIVTRSGSILLTDLKKLEENCSQDVVGET